MWYAHSQKVKGKPKSEYINEFARMLDSLLLDSELFKRTRDLDHYNAYFTKLMLHEAVIRVVDATLKVMLAVAEA
jgi:hypothetical protein